jgi:hypothetical protein
VQTFMMLFLGLAAAPGAEDQVTHDYNKQWGEYLAGLASAGSLESGAPFAPSGETVTRDSVSPVELQPLDIGGYALITAASLEEAVRIAKRAPHIALGGTTIVRPCFSGGM